MTTVNLSETPEKTTDRVFMNTAKESEILPAIVTNISSKQLELDMLKEIIQNKDMKAFKKIIKKEDHELLSLDFGAKHKGIIPYLGNLYTTKKAEIYLDMLIFISKKKSRSRSAMGISKEDQKKYFV